MFFIQLLSLILKRMKPVLIIAILILCFWSIFISFKAIYLILTKDFKGSKVGWILIVMIGIVGPIIWVVKGRKLVSLKD